MSITVSNGVSRGNLEVAGPSRILPSMIPRTVQKYTSRAELLNAQETKLNELWVAKIIKARSGFLFGLLSSISSLGLGTLFLALHDTGSLSHGAKTVMVVAGIISFTLGLHGVIKMLKRILAWKRESLLWFLVDRTPGTRALPAGDIERRLATEWDRRHDDRTPADDLEQALLDVHNPYTAGMSTGFGLGATPSILLAMLLSIVAIVTLVDSLGDNDTKGTVFSILIIVYVVLLIASWVMAMIFIDSAFRKVFRLMRIEMGAFPIRRGDNTEQRSTNTANGASLKMTLLLTVPLLAVFLIRAAQSSLVGALIVVVLTIIFLLVLVPQVHMTRLVPLIFDEGSVLGGDPRSLPFKGKIVVEFVGHNLVITSKSNRNQQLRLAKKDIIGLENVREAAPLAPLAIALVGQDDILAVVSGGKVSKQIIDWWKR